VILAEGAAEVAAGRGDREGAGTRQEMKEGLLLDGIDVFGDDPMGSTFSAMIAP